MVVKICIKVFFRSAAADPHHVSQFLKQTERDRTTEQKTERDTTDLTSPVIHHHQEMAIDFRRFFSSLLLLLNIIIVVQPFFTLQDFSLRASGEIINHKVVITSSTKRDLDVAGSIQRAPPATTITRRKCTFLLAWQPWRRLVVIVGRVGCKSFYHKTSRLQSK